MKRININITDRQNELLDVMSEETGVTKNGLICYALWEWLNANCSKEQSEKMIVQRGE